MNSSENRMEFWRKIGKIGVGSERRIKIPMAVKLSDGSISSDKNSVSSKWKNDFCNMLNKNHSNININCNNRVYDEFLDCEITS